MSKAKFEASVKRMVREAPMIHHKLAMDVGDLFKILYAEILSSEAECKSQKKKFNSRIAKKNFGFRIRSAKSRF